MPFDGMYYVYMNRNTYANYVCHRTFFADAFIAKPGGDNNPYHLLVNFDYDSGPVSAKHSAVQNKSRDQTSMAKRARVRLFSDDEKNENLNSATETMRPSKETEFL